MYRSRSRPGPTADLPSRLVAPPRIRSLCPAKGSHEHLPLMLFEVRGPGSPLPRQNANPGCGKATMFQISHHWGIACPNRDAILVRLKRRGGLGNDNRTNEGHSRLCSRRRGKELYLGGGTHRSVEVGGGQKRIASRRPVGRPPAAANDKERLANRGGCSIS